MYEGRCYTEYKITQYNNLIRKFVNTFWRATDLMDLNLENYDVTEDNIH